MRVELGGAEDQGVGGSVIDRLCALERSSSGIVVFLARILDEMRETNRLIRASIEKGDELLRKGDEIRDVGERVHSAGGKLETAMKGRADGASA